MKKLKKKSRKKLLKKTKLLLPVKNRTERNNLCVTRGNVRVADRVRNENASERATRRVKMKRRRMTQRRALQAKSKSLYVTID